MLHFYVKNFFTQILISSVLNGEQYLVQVINDYNDQITSIQVELLVYTYQSILILNSTKSGLSIPPLNSIYPFNISVKSILCPGMT
jgi:hypothetical protein